MKYLYQENVNSHICVWVCVCVRFCVCVFPLPTLSPQEKVGDVGKVKEDACFEKEIFT